MNACTLIPVYGRAVSAYVYSFCQFVLSVIKFVVLTVSNSMLGNLVMCSEMADFVFSWMSVDVLSLMHMLIGLDVSTM